MIGDLSRSTNNNIEHQGKEYVQFTLAPLAVAIEQQIGLQLLKPPFVAEHQLTNSHAEISRRRRPASQHCGNGDITR